MPGIFEENNWILQVGMITNVSRRNSANRSLSPRFRNRNSMNNNNNNNLSNFNSSSQNAYGDYEDNFATNFLKGSYFPRSNASMYGAGNQNWNNGGGGVNSVDDISGAIGQLQADEGQLMDFIGTGGTTQLGY